MPNKLFTTVIWLKQRVMEAAGIEPALADSPHGSTGRVRPAAVQDSWDESYLRWLEDPEKTLTTPLRFEIAARLRELRGNQRTGRILYTDAEAWDFE
jgi:hypothetical protein